MIFENQQANIFGHEASWEPRTQKAILDDIVRLRSMHERGLLGGVVMPEDANPGLHVASADNYHYFTLTMALNYQRNSYALWRAATQTYNDPTTRIIFHPATVVELDESILRRHLLRYKLALQPTNHSRIWASICAAIVDLLGGDVRELFRRTSCSAPAILRFVQQEFPERFPYLKGNKICNYWLYVMNGYTDAELLQREALNVAPDTHVVQASIRLGLVDPHCISKDRNSAADLVARAWAITLAGSKIAPIDVHTPLWLWSRAGFIPIVH
jgi:hypothetical protein